MTKKWYELQIVLHLMLCNVDEIWKTKVPYNGKIQIIVTFIFIHTITGHTSHKGIVASTVYGTVICNIVIHL